MATKQESEERFTDEELANLRHVRFGRLPSRVLPEDHVELVETGQRPDRAAPAGGEDDWMLRTAAG